MNCFDKKYKEKTLGRTYKIYISTNECFYGLAPCTNNIKSWEQLGYEKYFIFKKIYLKKNKI